MANRGDLFPQINSRSGKLPGHFEPEPAYFLGQPFLESFTGYAQHVILPLPTGVADNDVKPGHPIIAEPLPECPYRRHRKRSLSLTQDDDGIVGGGDARRKSGQRFV